MTNLKLLNGVAPVAQYGEAGVTIGLGCDDSSASDAQSPFQAMKLFALAWALQLGAAADGAAAQAFRAATTGGARALGLDGKIGGVAPGHTRQLGFRRSRRDRPGDRSTAPYVSSSTARRGARCATSWSPGGWRSATAP